MLIERAVAEAIKSISANSESSLWLGLSGGVDSTVLLHAVASFSSASSRKLKAIHVHHGLSENADAWAKHAQILCEELSQKFSITIDCIVEKVQLDDRSDGLEQAARSARYQAFSKHCGPNDILLQGHHLDDQIETFFMRAIRGSGLTGLASIPKQRSLSRDNTCQILRPLLTIEKNQLLEYAKKHQLNWVEDESNQDSKIERNWWRNELLPQIWQYYPKQKQSLSRTISNIQHEQDLLQKLLQDSLQSPLKGSISEIHSVLQDIPSFKLLLIQGLDQATSVSYLRAWFAQYVDILPSAIQMKTIYVDMVHARIDSDPSISWSASKLYRYQNHLYLLDATVLNLLDSSFDESQLHDWQGENLNCYWGRLTCNEKTHNYGLKPAQYQIRNWQAGDVAKPIGRATRKMKKWWQDYNVPSWVREQWPIIVNKETNEIAAVPGLFVCQGYRVEEGQVGWVVDYNVTIR
jgi:tRNA(Ile)-lysidine synthase